MKKWLNGNIVDMSDEEIIAAQQARAAYEAAERTRTLTESEVTRMVIAQQINSLDIDDATASRMAEYFPTLTGDGALIESGTRINWYGVVKRAAVDLWDNQESTPDAAPALWEGIAYKNGVRIIPETITAGTAFALDELGWWEDVLYQSKLDANVWTPTQNPDGWQIVVL